MADVAENVVETVAEVIDESVDVDGAAATRSWGPPMGTRRRAPRKFAKVAGDPRRVLTWALVSGVGFDLAVRQSQPGVATAMWCAVLLLGAAALAGRRGRASILVLVAAATFVPWFVLRSSPWLLIPDAMAFAALLVYAADLAAGGPVRRSVGGLCRVAASVAEAAVESVRFLGRTTNSAAAGVVTRRRVPWRGLGRALAIAAPVVAVLFVLLVSGDALFASMFDSGSSVDLSHVIAFVVGAWLFGVVATMATPPSRAPVVERRHPLRGLDAAVLLGGVAALFFVYACVQLSALLSGAQYVQDRTGLTYAQYARSGFFQLMAAATISFVVLCLVRPTVQRATVGARLLRWSVGAVVVLTQTLVVGSIIRIQLYSDVFGLTHLRLYTVVSAVWLGVVVLLAGVAAVRRGSGDWMAVTASALAALAVLAMNVVNPDLLVASENIGRVDTSAARFDTPYLASLSDDAVPWIVEHLADVPDEDRAELIDALCDRRGGGDGWLAWNRSASEADDSLRDICP